MTFPRRQFLHLATGAGRPPGHRADRMGAELSGPAGAGDRAVRGRRPDRCLRPPDRTEIVGAARPAVLRGERARCRRQHRHRPGREGQGRRLFHPHCGEQPCHKPGLVRPGSLRPVPGFRAGVARGRRSRRRSRSTLRCRPAPSRSWSPSSRPTPANTASLRRGWGRPRIFWASSSGSRSASTSCTFPSAAARRPSPRRWRATRRLLLRRCRWPLRSPGTASCGCSR